MTTAATTTKATTVANHLDWTGLDWTEPAAAAAAEKWTFVSSPILSLSLFLSRLGSSCFSYPAIPAQTDTHTVAM